MRRITILAFFMAVSVLVVSLNVFAFGNQTDQDIDSSNIRPEIKVYIDGLYDSEISSIGHTTDSVEESRNTSPDGPEIFDAGRYEVVFIGGVEKKIMIFETEEKVGHLSPVVPGETDIGGFVAIQKDPEDIDGLKLNELELDYLIRTLYRKFAKPMTDSQAYSLNQVKDYALAIKFSAKSGMSEYHNDLIKK